MEDEFSLLFSSKNRSKVSTSPGSGCPPRENPMPKSEEVEALEVQVAVINAHDQLDRAKRGFADKFDKLRKRALVVQKEQETLRKNLIKYNNFVREKEAKVEEGDRIFQKEKDFQGWEKEQIASMIEEKRHKAELLEKAKVLLEEILGRRRVFRDYMVQVVQTELEGKNRYKDIGELMKRCETLVVTRDESQATMKRLQDEILHQEAQLVAFKEAQHERVLTLSSQQNTFQEVLYQIQAKKESYERLLHQVEQAKINKELSIANIKLSILTLWQYVNSRKVLLPSDGKKGSAGPKTKEKPPSDIAKQLDAVKAHIEDLEVVIERVLRSENAERYMSPLLSEFSELRLDY